METRAEATNVRMTLEEWGALPEEDEGELVDGLLVQEEEVGALHEAVVAWLAFVIRTWLGTSGWVLTSDAKYAVGPERGRKPDLSIYLTRRKLPARAVIETPPDVAIEIVSPRPKDRRRDRFEKLHDYAAFGIRYYWLLDPEARTLEILARSEEGAYTIVTAAGSGRVVVPGCDGLVLDLDALWAEIADFD